ncbi:MAG: hypothetical protein LQ343_000320 [Gyalolechia ehrenbergii]|nr:MAG: hypothetical protein LQ343_000320 [Gyalolechia ehrenbergii]
MVRSVVNVLLTSFTGLGLPPTLSIPVPYSSSIAELRFLLVDRLPPLQHRLVFTTTSNKELSASSSAPISNLLSSKDDAIIPIRLSIPICGGKGGFGSQLRAAGGRMSSRRKRNQGDENSSNRNLDGRRLRTVAEAKALAEYLALKPEMEKKEKEARRKRWEQVVELAEKREEEIKNGSKGRVDGKWVEDRDEAGERTRDAVVTAMKSGQYHDVLSFPPTKRSEESSSISSQSQDDGDLNTLKSKAITSPNVVASSRTFFGFDDEEDLSSDDDEEGKSEVLMESG